MSYMYINTNNYFIIFKLIHHFKDFSIKSIYYHFVWLYTYVITDKPAMRELKTMVIESQHSISFRTSILGQRKKMKLLYRFSGKKYGNYCSHIIWRSLWLRLYGSWIYNYLCNLCLSPLTLWVRILLRRCVLDTTLCDKVCQWLAAGLWFFFGYSGFLHQ
jgi:hypothetical protein